MTRIYLTTQKLRETLSAQVRRFLSNERGESSVMSNIMMLAIAALVVIALWAFGQTGMKFLKDSWTTMTKPI